MTTVAALMRQGAQDAVGGLSTMLARVTGSGADETSPSPADQEPLLRGLEPSSLQPDPPDERSAFQKEWDALANEFNDKSAALAAEWSQWQAENQGASAAEYEATRAGFAKRGEELYQEREQAQNALLEQHGIPIE